MITPPRTRRQRNILFRNNGTPGTKSCLGNVLLNIILGQWSMVEDNEIRPALLLGPLLDRL